MLVNYYYGGLSATVVTERITRKRAQIKVRYGDDEICYDDEEGSLRFAQDIWARDAAERKNGLHRVTVEDPGGDFPIRWDSDLAGITQLGIAKTVTTRRET